MPTSSRPASCGLGAIQRTCDVQGRGGKLQVGADGMARSDSSSNQLDPSVTAAEDRARLAAGVDRPSAGLTATENTSWSRQVPSVPTSVHRHGSWLRRPPRRPTPGRDPKGRASPCGTLPPEHRRAVHRSPLRPGERRPRRWQREASCTCGGGTTSIDSERWGTHARRDGGARTAGLSRGSPVDLTRFGRTTICLLLTSDPPSRMEQRRMNEAFLVTGIRTPIGRYGGALSSVRPDDLAAHTIRALVEHVDGLDGGEIDEVILGCANQAGEDNRNVARMAALLAGLPETVPAVTVNRLCGSGLEAVVQAARAIRTGDCELVLAGGVESMSRAPFVLSKTEAPFSRAANLAGHDNRLALRQRAPRGRYGADSMPETAENVAAEFGISREDQDAFALRSQQRAAPGPHARTARAGDRAVPVSRPGDEPVLVARRASARHVARPARQPFPHPFAQGRHGDGRQRIGDQRRCRRAARSVRTSRREAGL